MIYDTLTEKTGEEIPNVGEFYDHADGQFIWGQNLVYTYYTDEKTGYPLVVRLDENDAETKIELATTLIGETEQKPDVPAETYLFDSWYCAHALVETVESYGKDCISALASDRLVEYNGVERRIDAVHDQVGVADREIDGEDCKIWTKKLPVSKLGEQKVILAEKVTDDEDLDNPVKYS